MSRARPLPLLAYGMATAAISPLAPAVLRQRARQGKEDPVRMSERLGRAGRPRPEGPLIWLHGASVGESLSLLPLVDALGHARPQASILVTSGTRTSAELLARWLPPEVIHQYVPVDTPDATRRFIQHWRPSLGVLAESELWPNLLMAAAERGTRLALLSAKLSASSAQGWSRIPASARRVLSSFDLILAKDDEAAARFRRLGGAVHGLADLKFGAGPLPVDAEALSRAQAEIRERPVILAASTHPGDDERVLAAFEPLRGHPSQPLLVIAPRHPERGPAIADLAWGKGGGVALRSIGEPPGAGAVYVADTLGELGLWMRLARLTVLGGGFSPDVGGHNPLEPIRLDCPFVSGPHVANWASVYDELWRAMGDGPIGDGPIGDGATLQDRMAIAIAADDALAQAARRAAAYVQARDAEARAVTSQVLALLP